MVVGNSGVNAYNGVSSTYYPFYGVNGFKTLRVLASATTVYNVMSDSMRATVTKVILPTTITTIMDSAFESCKNLKQDVTITSKITKVGSNAFKNSGITFKSVDTSGMTYSSSVGNNAFSGTTIEKLVVGQVGINSSNNANNGYYPFYDVNGFKTLEIKSDANTVYNVLSASMRKTVENVTVPKSVTTIYDEVFKDCISLKEIKLPRGVKTSTNTFINCPAKITYY